MKKITSLVRSLQSRLAAHYPSLLDATLYVMPSGYSRSMIKEFEEDEPADMLDAARGLFRCAGVPLPSPFCGIIYDAAFESPFSFIRSGYMPDFDRPTWMAAFCAPTDDGRIRVLHFAHRVWDRSEIPLGNYRKPKHVRVQPRFVNDWVPLLDLDGGRFGTFMLRRCSTAEYFTYLRQAREDYARVLLETNPSGRDCELEYTDTANAKDMARLAGLDWLWIYDDPGDLPYAPPHLTLRFSVIEFLARQFCPCAYSIRSTHKTPFGIGKLREDSWSKPFFTVVNFDRLYREVQGTSGMSILREDHHRRGHPRRHWKRAGIDRGHLPRDPAERLALAESNHVPVSWVNDCDVRFNKPWDDGNAIHMIEEKRS